MFISENPMDMEFTPVLGILIGAFVTLGLVGFIVIFVLRVKYKDNSSHNHHHNHMQTNSGVKNGMKNEEQNQGNSKDQEEYYGIRRQNDPVLLQNGNWDFKPLLFYTIVITVPYFQNVEFIQIYRFLD